MSDTAARIEALLRSHSGMKDIAFDASTDLVDDLDLDSLDRLEIAMLLEEQFDITIPDEDVDDSKTGTFGGLVAYVEGKVKPDAAALAAQLKRESGVG